MMQLSLYKLWRQRDFGTQTCEGRGELRSSNEKATKASDALKAVHEQPESHTPKSNKKGKRASKQRFTVVEPFAVEATLIEIGVGSRPVRRLMLVWSCKLCDTVFGCYH
ncbi:unnamed protein product [Prunus armeniaca]